MSQISQILSIAENTNHEGEREVAFQRASRMAAKYEIDLNVLRMQNKEKGEVERPTFKKFEVGEYRKRGGGAYSSLYLSIAHAHDLRAMMYGTSHIELYGYQSDIDMVEMIYMTIVVSMVTECIEYLEDEEWRSLGVNKNDARKSFYAGYIKRIGERLRAGRQEAEEEAEKEYAAQGISTALVIADRRKDINKLYYEKNRGVGLWNGAPKATNGTIARHGRAAANRTNISEPERRKIAE